MQFIPLSWLIILNPDKTVPFHIKGAGKTNWNLVICFLLKAETSIKDLTFKVHRYDFIELIFLGGSDDIYFAVVNLKGYKRRKVGREDWLIIFQKLFW